jgi:steroid delta-isomerase-like uncharacterized protein
MSTEENKSLIRRYMEEALNKGNVGIADQLFTPTFVFHFPGSPGPMDREGWKQTSAVFQSAFPNQHTTTDDLVAENDKLAARFTFRGTHQGVFQSIPPTGKSVTMTGMAIWRVVDGKIAEHWVEFDALGLMQQLGVIPAPGQSQL